MDPISLGLGAATIGEIGTGAAAAGGVMGAIGSVFSGLTGAASSKYKAQVAQFNAQVAEQNARYAIEAGGIAAEEKGLQEGQKRGAEVVAQAASGLQVGTGTGGKVLESMDAASKFDQGIIRWDAARRAQGFQIEAQSDLASARLDQAQAGWDVAAGGIGALSSILGAAGSVSDKWLKAGTIGLYTSNGGTAP